MGACEQDAEAAGPRTKERERACVGARAFASCVGVRVCVCLWVCACVRVNTVMGCLLTGIARLSWQDTSSSFGKQDGVIH